MRYKVIVEYNGSNFYGWSRQKGLKTIQETIEQTLSLCLNENIVIHASGRTDKYVHAINQVFHFDSSIEINNFMINNINNYFKDKILIKSIQKVNDKFHARFDVKVKTYMYKINIGNKNIFESDTCLQYNKKIDLKKIKKLKNIFVGEHNFLSFSTSEKENTIRNIYDIRFKKQKNYIYIFISGNGFLRNMVRMIVSCMLSYNENNITIEQIKWLLNNPKKGSSINKANGCGLYLYNVEY